MEDMQARYRIVFEKLAEAARDVPPGVSEDDAHNARVREAELESIAELCRLSAEIAQPASVLFTTT